MRLLVLAFFVLPSVGCSSSDSPEAQAETKSGAAEAKDPAWEPIRLMCTAVAEGMKKDLPRDQLATYAAKQVSDRYGENAPNMKWFERMAVLPAAERVEEMQKEAKRLGLEAECASMVELFREQGKVNKPRPQQG